MPGTHYIACWCMSTADPCTVSKKKLISNKVTASCWKTLQSPTNLHIILNIGAVNASTKGMLRACANDHGCSYWFDCHREKKNYSRKTSSVTSLFIWPTVAAEPIRYLATDVLRYIVVLKSIERFDWSAWNLVRWRIFTLRRIE